MFACLIFILLIFSDGYKSQVCKVGKKTGNTHISQDGGETYLSTVSSKIADVNMAANILLPKFIWKRFFVNYTMK